MSDEAELIDEAAEFRAYPTSVQPGIPTLGDVPKGWSVLPMGKLLKVVQRPLKMIDDDVYQLVTARRNRGGLIAREQLTGAKIATKTQFRVKAGDFVMSRRQIAHGACGILPADLDDALVSNEYAALLPTNELDKDFLRHLPHSVYFQQTCFHSSIGVHVEKLVFNLDHWLTWPFFVPSPGEQRRIATVLDAWDTAMRAAERLAEAKRARVASVAYHLLAKSSSSDVPLDEVAEINGQSLGSNTAPDFEFEYFPIGSDEGGGWMRFEDAPSRARRTAATGDVVYSTVRPLLRRIFRAPPHNSAVYSTGYAVLAPREGHDAGYLFHCMTTHAFESQILARLTGSNYPAIGAKDLGELVIPACDLPRQSEIALILDAATAAQRSAEALVGKLREQKRGLMQQLLTGKLPVPESIDALLPPAPELVAAA